MLTKAATEHESRCTVAAALRSDMHYLSAHHKLWNVGSWVNSIQIPPIMAMNSVRVILVPPNRLYTACKVVQLYRAVDDYTG